MFKRALMILAEGFEDIEAVAPIDVLTRAGVEVTVASLTSGQVKAAYGLIIQPTTTVDTISGLYDAIIFPGGRKNAQSLSGNIKAVALAREQFESGKIVAAICAAPSHVLGEAAKLLQGKRATGDPSFNDKLAASGAIVTNENVTQDGTIITGMGPGAAMLFALLLAENLAGKEIADGFAAKWHITR